MSSKPFVFIFMADCKEVGRAEYGAWPAFVRVQQDAAEVGATSIRHGQGTYSVGPNRARTGVEALF